MGLQNLFRMQSSFKPTNMQLQIQIRSQNNSFNSGWKQTLWKVDTLSLGSNIRFLMNIEESAVYLDFT